MRASHIASLVPGIRKEFDAGIFPWQAFFEARRCCCLHCFFWISRKYASNYCFGDACWHKWIPHCCCAWAHSFLHLPQNPTAFVGAWCCPRQWSTLHLDCHATGACRIGRLERIAPGSRTGDGSSAPGLWPAEAARRVSIHTFLRFEQCPFHWLLGIRHWQISCI